MIKVLLKRSLYYISSYTVGYCLVVADIAVVGLYIQKMKTCWQSIMLMMSMKRGWVFFPIQFWCGEFLPFVTKHWQAIIYNPSAILMKLYIVPPRRKTEVLIHVIGHPLRQTGKKIIYVTDEEVSYFTFFPEVSNLQLFYYNVTMANSRPTISIGQLYNF